jgi:hypothetical protein
MQFLPGQCQEIFYSGFLLAPFPLCCFLVAVCAHMSWFYTVDWWQASDVKGGKSHEYVCKVQTHGENNLFKKFLSQKSSDTVPLNPQCCVQKRKDKW